MALQPVPTPPLLVEMATRIPLHVLEPWWLPALSLVMDMFALFALRPQLLPNAAPLHPVTFLSLVEQLEPSELTQLVLPLAPMVSYPLPRPSLPIPDPAIRPRALVQLLQTLVPLPTNVWLAPAVLLPDSVPMLKDALPARQPMFAVNAKELWFPPVPLPPAVVPQPTVTVIWLPVPLPLAISMVLPAKPPALHVLPPLLVNASPPTMDTISVLPPPELPRLLLELWVTRWHVLQGVCLAPATPKHCVPLGIPFMPRMPLELLLKPQSTVLSPSNPPPLLLLLMVALAALLGNTSTWAPAYQAVPSAAMLLAAASPSLALLAHHAEPTVPHAVVPPNAPFAILDTSLLPAFAPRAKLDALVALPRRRDHACRHFPDITLPLLLLARPELPTAPLKLLGSLLHAPMLIANTAKPTMLLLPHLPHA